MDPNDLPVAWSTQFRSIFDMEYNQAVAVSRAEIDRLIQEIDIPNFSGNKINIDWLGGAPQLREWVDEKQAKSIANYTWSVTVRRWEATVAVDMDTMLDARGNPYEARFREMTQNASRLPFNLISGLISGGTAAAGYDAINFFATTHAEGDSGTQSNLLTGTGVTLAALTTDYYTALAALNGFKDDKGLVMQPTTFRPLVWIPNAAGLVQNFKTLKAASLVSNNTNILTNEFDLVIDPTLTDTNDWYIFRSGDPLKPFISVNREPMHYEDDFLSGDRVFTARAGKASVVGRYAMTYGMWQKAVKITNT